MKALIWVFLIFICAGIFRLTNLDLIEFKLDEARDVYEMERFYNDPYFIQRGTIQSTGVYNPPLWYYLLALFALPSRDPQYLSFMIALVNCLSIACLYLVVRKYYGQMIALGSSLFLAFSPWSILLSRKIWAPDLVLPLVVIWLYFIHKLIVDKKPKAILGVILLSGLLAQLHASGIFLGVTTIIIVGVNRLRINWKFALVGLILSLLPLLPYLGYQLQNNCPDCQAFLSYQEGEALVTPFFDGNNFLRPFQFINGSSWMTILGEEGYQDFLTKYPFIKIFEFIFLFEFLLLFLGVFIILKEKRQLWWLAGFLVLMPTLYFLTKTPGHLYYFVIVSPIVILIYTLGLELFRKRWIPISLGITMLLVNIIFEISFYQFLSEQRVIRGDYGATFGVIKELTEQQGLTGQDKTFYWVNLFNK